MVVAGNTAWIWSGSSPAFAVPCGVPAGMKRIAPGSEATRLVAEPRVSGAREDRDGLVDVVRVERDAIAHSDLLGDDRQRVDAPPLVTRVDLQPPA